MGNNEFASLYCEATGYPNVTIQWMHNGHNVIENSKYAIMSVPAADSVVSSHLNISKLNATDNGNVTCLAQIRGCDAEKSYKDCEPKMFPVISASNLAVISEFMYTHI